MIGEVKREARKIDSSDSAGDVARVPSVEDAVCADSGEDTHSDDGAADW